VMAQASDDKVPRSLPELDTKRLEESKVLLGALPWTTRFSRIAPAEYKPTGHTLWTIHVDLDKATEDKSAKDVPVFLRQFETVYAIQRQQNKSFALRFFMIPDGVTFRSLLRIGAKPEVRARLQAMQTLARRKWPETLHCVGCTVIQFPKSIGPLVQLFQSFFTRKINPPRFVTTSKEVSEALRERLTDWPKEPQPYGMVRADNGFIMTAELIAKERVRIEAEHAKAMADCASTGAEDDSSSESE